METIWNFTCFVLRPQEGPDGGGMARGVVGRAGGFFRFTGDRGGHAARAAHAGPAGASVQKPTV